MPTPSDNTPRELVRLVLDKIALLGEMQAAEYFEVSRGTIKAWKELKSFPSIVAAQKVWDESLVCLSPEIWGKAEHAKIQICLPIYGMIDPLTHVTLLNNYRQYGVEKINPIPKMRTLIDEARNDLAKTFLLSKSEWCVFVDGDMVLPIGNAATLRKHGWKVPDRHGNRVALTRLMSHPPEFRIVGALYRDRRNLNRAQCERGFRSAQENQRLIDIMDGKGTDDGLEENGWVGMGFVRIHRSVFEEMAAEAKPGGLLEDIAPPKGREGEPIGFFGRTSKFRGEDIAMCRRAGLCGITTHVDVGCYVGHRGDQIF